VKVTNLKVIFALIGLATAASACGTPGQSATPTRVATQTPWVIYVPVTTTPEPATITPLPTVTSVQPTRAPTRIPPTKAPPTKAPPTAAPVAAAPTKTPVPACELGTATPTFPEDGAPRHTPSDAIIFKWDPPSTLTGPTDPHVGYRVEIESRRGGQHINGVVLYISANKYLQDGQAVLDKRAVAGLAGNDNATATWTVTVVKASGDFSETDLTSQPAGLINCGAPSRTMSVQLIYSGG
jgi:hypothetical protein